MDESRIQQAKSRLGIIGNAPQLLKAVGRALLVAPIDMSVLVTGESGSGKEFFPQIIHQNSPRKHAKYIAVNCGAIPEGTIDSELFGHEKGAFTGAVTSRKGYFEEANGGTIFLDEVAELPLTTQARLLRVLETGEYIKVGSSDVQKTDIRIVAATNVNLLEAVAEGRFREDLYYRLATVIIQVPPLRDRGNDILLLARKFASDFCDRNMVPQFTFTEDARRRLLSYRWPGNVRQLKNVVEQVALFEAGEEVGAKTLDQYLPENVTTELALSAGRHLPVSTRPAENDHTYEREREMLFSLIFKMKNEIEELHKEVRAMRRDTSHGGDRRTESKSLVSYAPPGGVDYPSIHPRTSAPIPDVDDADPEEVNEVIDTTARPLSEKEMIRLCLERNMGRRKAAATELNISERTLYRKIKEYGLE